MQKVQGTAVRFKVARAIELEPGIVLRPGVYTGIKTRTRVDSIGGVSWTPSQYKLEFTADQLTSMKQNLIAKNIDVTKFVRLVTWCESEVAVTFEAGTVTPTSRAITPVKPQTARAAATAPLIGNPAEGNTTNVATRRQM
jgi:hypothetical protein